MKLKEKPAEGGVVSEAFELKKSGSDRDQVETVLKEIFGDKIISTEEAAEAINQRKDGSFGMSEMVLC